MPPFLALCGGVVGVGVVENGWTFFITLCQPDISTHISISAAHRVSSHTDRASREMIDHAGRGLYGNTHIWLAREGGLLPQNQKGQRGEYFRQALAE
eukprot:scaffold14150_cov108-Isochrysis_galbana.AAC.3